MKRAIGLFTLIFVFQLFVYAQQASLDDKLKEIDAYAKQVMADWKGPGMAIAIVKDDKVVLQKGYGVRQLGKPEPVDADTDFAIASNSKAFTAAALATLVDEKKINWDDKVTKYLPDFQMYDPWVTSELTIVVNAADFRPGGVVRVDATVTASLVGISIFGATHITLHHQHVEPVDPYRNRQ